MRKALFRSAKAKICLQQLWPLSYSQQPGEFREMLKLVQGTLRQANVSATYSDADIMTYAQT
jgi:hypothetical protein